MEVGVDVWRDKFLEVLELAAFAAHPVVLLLYDKGNESDLHNAFADVSCFLQATSAELMSLFSYDAIQRIESKIENDFAYFAELARDRTTVVCIFENSSKVSMLQSATQILGNTFANTHFHGWTSKNLELVARENVVLESVEDIDVFSKIAPEIYKMAKAEVSSMKTLTPCDFLRFLAEVSRAVEISTKKMAEETQRYASGIEKIAQARQQVQDMQDELLKLAPVVARKTQETEELLKNIAADKARIEENGAIIEAEEKHAAAEKRKCEE